MNSWLVTTTMKVGNTHFSGRFQVNYKCRHRLKRYWQSWGEHFRKYEQMNDQTKKRRRWVPRLKRFYSKAKSRETYKLIFLQIFIRLIVQSEIGQALDNNTKIVLQKIQLVAMSYCTLNHCHLFSWKVYRLLSLGYKEMCAAWTVNSRALFVRGH